MFLLLIQESLDRNKFRFFPWKGGVLMSPRPILANQIKEEARRLGFDAVGIVRLPTPLPSMPCPPAHSTLPLAEESIPLRLLGRLKKWLDLRFHGTMEWIAKDPKRRSNPAEVLPGCQSLVVVGMNYYTDHTPDESKVSGRIARYAWGKDYHGFMKDRLTQLENFLHAHVPDIQTRSYVDTGPIMEKAWAQEAGIGWIGKHTNMVSTDFGSVSYTHLT